MIIGLSGWAGDRRSGLAMRGAQALAEHFAACTGRTLRMVGEPTAPAHTRWPQALQRATPQLQRAKDAVADALRRQGQPLVFSNRCAASLGSLAAALQVEPELHVLWLDAHGDFNTPATTQTGYLGGMVLSALCGLWNSGLGAGLSPDRLWLVGTRDLEADERTLLNRHGVQVLQDHGGALDTRRCLSALYDRPLWVHLDLDVLEPGQLPAEYQVPGGLQLGTVAALLRSVSETSRVVGIEVAEYEYDAAQFPQHAAMLEQVLAPWCASGRELPVTRPVRFV